jgi:hypothetical protein
MSRVSVAVALASLLVACGACSKKPDTAATAKTTDTNLPQVVDKTDKAPPATDTSFKLAISTPPIGPAGAEAVAHVTVTPAQGWHVNKDFPIKLALTPPEGLTLTKAVMETGDVAKLDDNELTFDVKMKAAKAGSYKIDGELKFAVCTPETCDPKKQPINITMVAQ